MRNNNSSAIGFNRYTVGMPISFGTSSAISKALVMVSPSGKNVGQNEMAVFKLEWRESVLEQTWQWTEVWEQQANILDAGYTQEKSWDEAMEQVLRSRAATWKELAGL